MAAHSTIHCAATCHLKFSSEAPKHLSPFSIHLLSLQAFPQIKYHLPNNHCKILQTHTSAPTKTPTKPSSHKPQCPPPHPSTTTTQTGARTPLPQYPTTSTSAVRSHTARATSAAPTPSKHTPTHPFRTGKSHPRCSPTNISVVYLKPTSPY
jgi:hypothetical protein